MIRYQWTKPYYGVQHLENGTRWRVSVCDYGSFCELHCWFPGCGFSPTQQTLDTANDARKAGESWLAQNSGVAC